MRCNSTSSHYTRQTCRTIIGVSLEDSKIKTTAVSSPRSWGRNCTLPSPAKAKTKKTRKWLHLLLPKAALPSLFARSCFIAIYASKHWYKNAWSNRWTAEVPRHLLGVPLTLSSPRLSWAPSGWSVAEVWFRWGEIGACGMWAPCCLLVAAGIYSASLSNKAIESQHEGVGSCILNCSGHLRFIVSKSSECKQVSGGCPQYSLFSEWSGGLVDALCNTQVVKRHKSLGGWGSVQDLPLMLHVYFHECVSNGLSVCEKNKIHPRLNCLSKKKPPKPAPFPAQLRMHSRIRKDIKPGMRAWSSLSTLIKKWSYFVG